MSFRLVVLDGRVVWCDRAGWRDRIGWGLSSVNLGSALHGSHFYTSYVMRALRRGCATQ